MRTKACPIRPAPPIRWGWAYYHNGAFSVAAPLFEDATKKVPGSANYHYHLGLAYQKLNDNSRARVELEKVISLDPKSPVAEQARQALGQSAGKHLASRGYQRAKKYDQEKREE